MRLQRMFSDYWIDEIRMFCNDPVQRESMTSSRRRPAGHQPLRVRQACLAFPPRMFEPANGTSRMRKDIGQAVETCLVCIYSGGNVSPRVGASDHYDTHHTAPNFTKFLSCNFVSAGAVSSIPVRV